MLCKNITVEYFNQYLRHKYLDIGKKVSWIDTVKKVYKNNGVGRSVCIFAHFNHCEMLTVGAIHSIKQLKQAGIDLVFVSSSEICNDSDVKLLCALCDVVIVRENIGYDFGSWATGVNFITNDQSFDRLFLVNDSVIGPISEIYNTINNPTSADLWGITESNELATHLQSYFLCFEEKAIRSGFLKAFFSNIRSHSLKNSVILFYEIGLTLSAFNHGLSVKALVSQEDLRNSLSVNTYHIIGYPRQDLNPTLRFADHLISHYSIPYIKRELIQKNPYRSSLSGVSKYILESKLLPADLKDSLRMYIINNEPNF